MIDIILSKNEKVEHPNMKVVSLNVFFGEKNRRQRMIDICKMIKNYNPYIILLQEVHEKVLDIFMNQLCKNKNYQTSPIFIKSIQESKYGNIIFVKTKNYSQFITFDYYQYSNTFMMRGIAVAVLNNTMFMSTHLESLQTKQMEEIRKKQLKEINVYVKKHNFKNVIIGMDSNFKKSLPIQDDYVDVVYPLKKSTWHGRRFFNHDGEEIFDRFLVSKNISKNIEPVKIVECLMSDHDILELVF